MNEPTTEQLHKMINEKEVMPALFLDWDGTIRRSKKHEFIYGPDDIALFKGVDEKIWKYRNDGWLIIGISNQGGVAWGIKTEKDITNEREATFALFGKNPFHAVKMCFHHPKGDVEPYCHDSQFRKPHTGMISEAETDCFNAGYIIDYSKSIFVGDRPEDEECADNAGIRFAHAKDFFGV